MNINLLKLGSVITLLISVSTTAFSQKQADGRQGNIIPTAMPILGVSPDSRSGAMGDVGAAISPDANASFWNPAKLAFLEDKYGFSLSYSPWLQGLAPDINLGYLAGYYRLDERNVLGASFRYFALGNIQYTLENGLENGIFSPNEFSFDVTYARSFGENFSLGTAVRYINSNIFSGQQVQGQDTKAGTTFAADVSAYYKDETQFFGLPSTLAFGLNVSNIGPKLGYTDNETARQFLPTNMRLGLANTFHADDMSDFTFAFDINKLLVPTPDFIIDPTGNGITQIDRNRNKSVPAGIFGSFSDAPGGFKEEMQEISYSAGLEYWYNKQFALRTGYFYENPNKGNRQYLTVGAGLRYNIVDINLSYLLANQTQSPMAQTLRFSLLFNFGASTN
jgi:hypothetical protein